MESEYFKWYVFSKREKMSMKKKSGDINEKKLFHGTSHKYIDAICRQGFDFRFSGQSTGTKYGKGSYFTKSAKFADSYTDRSRDKEMFLVRVLAGDYTLGQITMVRPPHKTPPTCSICTILVWMIWATPIYLSYLRLIRYTRNMSLSTDPKLKVCWEEIKVVRYKIQKSMIDCSDFNHISSRKQILWTPSIGKLPDIKVTVYKLFPMFQTFHDHLYVMF